MQLHKKNPKYVVISLLIKPFDLFKRIIQSNRWGEMGWGWGGPKHLISLALKYVPPVTTSAFPSPIAI